MDEAPNRAAFFFGIATGTSCLEIDVLHYYMGINHQLGVLLVKATNQETKEIDVEAFEESFLEVAERHGFDRFLSPKDPLYSDFASSSL